MTWKTRYYHLLDSLQRRKGRSGGREPREARERQPRTQSGARQPARPKPVRSIYDGTGDRLTRPMGLTEARGPRVRPSRPRFRVPSRSRG